MELLNHAAVMRKCSASRTKLFEWRNNPEMGFPEPVMQSPLLWLDADIDAWLLALRDKAKKRRAQPELDQAMRDMAAGK